MAFCKNGVVAVIVCVYVCVSAFVSWVCECLEFKDNVMILQINSYISK